MKEWLKCAGIRAIKTVAQTAIACPCFMMFKS